ncbi:MAG TPA: hypothetical protein VNL13_01875 [Sulfolobales archaeon]|nr:hypothetical protein [Sulfolobales archaeon]
MRPLEPGSICTEDLQPSCGSIVERVRTLGYETIIPGSRGIMWIGEGFSSRVFLIARSDGSIAALKIRRSFSKVNTLEHEAYILRILRGCSVQPRLFDYGNDHLLIEYIQGISLGKLLKIHEMGRISDEYLRIAVASAIRSLYELDLYGVDHKEIVDPRKHIIYHHGSPYRARIIDFESASLKERANNIPRFVGGFLLRRLRWILRDPEEGVRNLMRIYKAKPDQREEIIRDLERTII